MFDYTQALQQASGGRAFDMGSLTFASSTRHSPALLPMAVQGMVPSFYAYPGLDPSITAGFAHNMGVAGPVAAASAAQAQLMSQSSMGMGIGMPMQMLPLGLQMQIQAAQAAGMRVSMPLQLPLQMQMHPMNLSAAHTVSIQTVNPIAANQGVGVEQSRAGAGTVAASTTM